MKLREVEKNWLDAIRLYGGESWKWILMSLYIGGIGGFVGVWFHHGLAEAAAFRAGHPWALFLLPLLGLVIVFLYRKCGMPVDRGTNRIIDSVRENEPVPLRVAPLIIVATILTQLGGGSAGREGAALQVGGSIGSSFSHRLGKRLGLPVRSQKVGVMCGMSAVFTALFGTPITATLFSLEVVEPGMMSHLALLPCLLSALVAFLVAGFFGGEATSIRVVQGIPVTAPLMLRTMALAFLCAFVCIFFCWAMHEAGHLYERFFKNPYLRVAVGGLLVIGLSFLLGSEFTGAGMNLVEAAVAGKAHGYTFLFKILFTAVTLGAGYKGGEIVPSMAIGASFGCAVGALLGIDPSLGAALGLVAFFCGVVNCPVASIFLGLELCGGTAYLLLFAIVAAVSLLFSGKCSLYSSQRAFREKTDARVRL